ncbi:MAG: hypothetical protein R3307_02985, partial [Anaerolineales bacterium]|nr:hypothetical protein [Anaerolineales bacterium]
MNQDKLLTRNWIVYGAILGILADIAYASAIAPVPLPDNVRMYMGMAFGPLLSLAFIGFYHFFRLHRNSVMLQASIIYAIIAGTIVNVMIVVQSAIFATIPREARSELGLAFDGLNMVQLGLDVSWDIYLSLATILLGLIMFGHPRFGVVWGIVAILIGGGLLILNLGTFPIPPAEANSIDLGPFTGVFYLFASIRVLTSLKWVDQLLSN